MDLPDDLVSAVETRTEKIWVGKDGIVRYLVKPTREHTLEDAIENVDAGIKLCAGVPTPSIIDIRKVNKVNREARMYYAGEPNSRAVNAAAILINNPVSRIIGNFFLGLNKTVFPTKLFTDEKKAVEWLKGFL